MYNLTTLFTYNMHYRRGFSFNKKGGMISGDPVDDDLEHDGFDLYLLEMLSELETLREKSHRSIGVRG